jgi:hypothetical protein
VTASCPNKTLNQQKIHFKHTAYFIPTFASTSQLKSGHYICPFINIDLFNRLI